MTRDDPLGTTRVGRPCGRGGCVCMSECVTASIQQRDVRLVHAAYMLNTRASGRRVRVR